MTHLFPLYGILVQAEAPFDIPGLYSIPLPERSEACSFAHMMKLTVTRNACTYAYGVTKISKGQLDADRSVRDRSAPGKIAADSFVQGNFSYYVYHIPGCCYKIGNGYMEVHYTDINAFIETFMNVPMSLYIVVNQLGILLHASSVCSGNRVTAFCGKKRAGKSTILQAVMKDCGLAYGFYSDDTIRLLPGEVTCCFPSLPILKAETLDARPVFRASNGKNFYLVNDGIWDRKYEQPYELKNVFFLRDRSERLVLHTVEDPMRVQMLLCNNISGYPAFPDSVKAQCIHAVKELCVTFRSVLTSFTDNKTKLQQDIVRILEAGTTIG